MATAYETLLASVERMLSDMSFLRDENAKLRGDLAAQKLQNAHTLTETEAVAKRVDSLLTRLGVATTASPMAVALRAKLQAAETFVEDETPPPNVPLPSMTIRNVSFKSEQSTLL